MAERRFKVKHCLNNRESFQNLFVFLRTSFCAFFSDLLEVNLSSTGTAKRKKLRILTLAECQSIIYYWSYFANYFIRNLLQVGYKEKIVKWNIYKKTSDGKSVFYSQLNITPPAFSTNHMAVSICAHEFNAGEKTGFQLQILSPFVFQYLFNAARSFFCFETVLKFFFYSVSFEKKFRIKSLANLFISLMFEQQEGSWTLEYNKR